jgi:hypothetical protein
MTRSTQALIEGAAGNLGAARDLHRGAVELATGAQFGARFKKLRS